MVTAQLSIQSKLNSSFPHLKLSETQLQSLPAWESISDYKALHGGMSGKVFVLESPVHPYVMRLIPLAKGPAEVEKEIYYAQVMATANISPHVYYADPQEGLVFMDYVTTQPLRLEDGRYPLSFYSKLASLLKKLHAQKPSLTYTSNMLTRTQAALASLTLPLPPFLGEFMQRLEANAALLAQHAETALVHQDLNPNNVLFDGQRLWLIDWELTGQGDPCYDLATVLIFFALSEQEQQHFLSSYFGGPPSSKDEAKIYLAHISALAFYGIILQKIAAHPQFADFEQLAPRLPKLKASLQAGKRWADFDSPTAVSSFGMMLLQAASELLEAPLYQQMREALR